VYLKLRYGVHIPQLTLHTTCAGSVLEPAWVTSQAIFFCFGVAPSFLVSQEHFLMTSSLLTFILKNNSSSASSSQTLGTADGISDGDPDGVKLGFVLGTAEGIVEGD